ncbi:hypothetical protein [Cereibacter sphaeroides]|jgi:hypothetical protein|uniref:hypothetical protein n=1 Tax=Cereibacter sphaeroides TaxID=1063 RepID=UPI0000663E59|nr:hypothetical protein Rsph17029_0656 [Cereibacter sphaeroides ATCC 17029]
MRLDPALLRDMLLDLEDAPTAFLRPSRDDTRVWYHYQILADDGLVAACGESYRLTRAGHDTCALLRDATLWYRVMEISEEVGGLSWAIMIELCSARLSKRVERSIHRTGIDVR